MSETTRGTVIVATPPPLTPAESIALRRRHKAALSVLAGQGADPAELLAAVVWPTDARLISSSTETPDANQ